MLGSRSRYLTELKMNCLSLSFTTSSVFIRIEKIGPLGLYICMPVNSNPAKRFNKTQNFDLNAHKKFLLRDYLP